MKNEEIAAFFAKKLTLPMPVIHSMLSDALKWKSVQNTAMKNQACVSEASAFLKDRFSKAAPNEDFSEPNDVDYDNLAFYELYSSQSVLESLADLDTSGKVEIVRTTRKEAISRAKDAEEIMIPDVMEGAKPEPKQKQEEEPAQDQNLETKAAVAHKVSDNTESIYRDLEMNIRFANRQLATITDQIVKEMSIDPMDRDVETIGRLNQHGSFYRSSLAALLTMREAYQAVNTVKE